MELDPWWKPLGRLWFPPIPSPRLTDWRKGWSPHILHDRLSCLSWPDRLDSQSVWAPCCWLLQITEIAIRCRQALRQGSSLGTLSLRCRDAPRMCIHGRKRAEHQQGDEHVCGRELSILEKGGGPCPGDRGGGCGMPEQGPIKEPCSSHHGPPDRMEASHFTPHLQVCEATHRRRCRSSKGRCTGPRCFGVRDWFHGKQFFHRWWGRGDGFRMILTRSMQSGSRPCTVHNRVCAPMRI